MEKSKTGKYFKYAFGEIILVVIGILIALQINNWNENRKAKSRLKSDLLELKSELSVDQVRIDSVLNVIEYRDEQGQYLLDFLSQKPKIIDSLKVINALIGVTVLASFAKSNTAYESLINNGNFQLVKNKVLKDKLGFFHNTSDWGSDYHDGPLLGSYYEYIKMIHKYTRPGYVRKYYESIWPKRNEALTNELRNSSFDSHIDFNELVKAEELLILLDRVQLSRYLQKIIYRNIKDEIVELSVLIDNELENLNY